MNKPNRVRAALLVAAAGLAGCAPGAWNEQSEFDKFIYKLQAACPYARSGQWQMYSGGAQLVNNATFLDLTSRLYYGKISRAQYASGVAAQTFGREDDPAIQCVFNNLPAGAGQGAAPGPMYAPPPPSTR
ncbi:MAG: hypothetical protein MUC55_03900 [Burkholderiales bacterium]|jgi:hypothetical protein|nr:hypothetical protein [Burkholderiales bacterium]